MGVSYPGTLVRTGHERATLVRRTYGLVFISIIVTALGTAFAFTQPALMEAVARHPIISMLAMFVPLFMAMQARRSVPRRLARATTMGRRTSSSAVDMPLMPPTKRRNSIPVSFS